MKLGQSAEIALATATACAVGACSALEGIGDVPLPKASKDAFPCSDCDATRFGDSGSPAGPSDGATSDALSVSDGASVSDASAAFDAADASPFCSVLHATGGGYAEAHDAADLRLAGTSFTVEAAIAARADCSKDTEGKPMPSVRVGDAAIVIDFRPSGLGEIGGGIALFCVGGLTLTVGGVLAGISQPSISNPYFDLGVVLFVGGLVTAIWGVGVIVTGILDLSGPKLVVRRSGDARPSQRRQIAVVPWIAPLSAPSERAAVSPAGAMAGVSVAF